MGVGGWADWDVRLCLYVLRVASLEQSFHPPAEGELLLFAWPKRSNQEKGHPTWRLPGYARQVREPRPGFSTGLLS